jgi:hypothetical protein
MPSTHAVIACVSGAAVPAGSDSGTIKLCYTLVIAQKEIDQVLSSAQSLLTAVVQSMPFCPFKEQLGNP